MKKVCQDLILYDGHVGIYIGGDQIVNAIDEQNGIGISSALSMEVITVREFYKQRQEGKQYQKKHY